MKLDQVSIHYDQQKIIESLSLEVNKGEVFVLMGPSGSGKSSLLKGIGGLIPFSGGAIESIGKTGLVFQDPRLFPHMTVLENLAFGLRAKGVSLKERNGRVREFVELLQLEGLENRYPHQLSGGQQQRVSLGRVLVLKPDLLLLDEPFASLDTPLRIQLTGWLVDIQKVQGFSILWVTHFIDEAFSVADRVGVLMNGKLEQVGKPFDFYNKPHSEKVASFFALPNRFSAKTLASWIPNLDIEHEMGWIPPNALVTLEAKSQLGKEASVWVEGIVQKIKHEANGQVIIVEVNGHCLEVEVKIWGKFPKLGSLLKVGIPINKIIWYSKD